MKSEFPEVEDFVRMRTPQNVFLTYEGQALRERQLLFTSADLFKVFDFKLKRGDPDTALDNPFSLVLSEDSAEKIFGTEDPMGQMIQIGPDYVFKVTGVAENPPQNSTIDFTSLASFSSLYQMEGLYMGWNGGNQYVTFIRLRERAEPAELEQKFPPFLWKHINQHIASVGWKYEAYLQPLGKIHFHFDRNSRTALANFYTFSAVALFILLIACVNFVNLTTARASGRAREVGMRKVLGAHKLNLIRQFIGETLILTLIAFAAGIGLVFLLTPVYSHLLDKDLNVISTLNLPVILGLLTLILAVGFISGLYPAFFLSSFQPIKTLKGVIHSGRQKKTFRNALVIFQFFISVTLIISTLLIRNQLRFIKNADVGYDRENMIVIRLNDKELRSKTDDIRNELLKIPGVLKAAASSNVPYRGFTRNGYIPEGFTDSMMFYALDVDEDFFETYGIPIAEGRSFSEEHRADERSILINQALVRLLEWEEPIGKTIRRNGDWRVIGVVKDFQFQTLRDTTGPLFITQNPWGNRFYCLSIKISGTDISQTLKTVEKVYKGFSPLLPFEYFFLDDEFEAVYRSEERFQRIFLYFSTLAILIALMGLFSLSAYSARQRSKEIGIRKVLGATIPGIMSLFSREMTGLILAANILAWPAAFFIINRWLANFAYRNVIGWQAFAASLAGSLLAALITISFQAFKAAVKSPLEEIRTE
jgi:putative ABC transport system permease protein